MRSTTGELPAVHDWFRLLSSRLGCCLQWPVGTDCEVTTFNVAIRGILHEKLGQFEEAVADFSEVIRLDPDNVNAFFSRGSALDSLGHFERAVQDYTKALVLDGSAVEGLQQTSMGLMHADNICSATSKFSSAADHLLKQWHEPKSKCMAWVHKRV
jgi:tetratricopeptide (TPR) repeat protein